MFGESQEGSLDVLAVCLHVSQDGLVADTLVAQAERARCIANHLLRVQHVLPADRLGSAMLQVVDVPLRPR
eukprot:2771171-Alexandrium_andersonii.AAC.1